MMVNISIEQRASTNRLRKRSGKVLVLLAVSMPAIFGLMALIFDAGLLSADCQDLQQATDAAATAGAYEILQGRSSSVATMTVSVSPASRASSAVAANLTGTPARLTDAARFPDRAQRTRVCSVEPASSRSTSMAVALLPIMANLMQSQSSAAAESRPRSDTVERPAVVFNHFPNSRQRKTRERSAARSPFDWKTGRDQ